MSGWTDKSLYTMCFGEGRALARCVYLCGGASLSSEQQHPQAAHHGTQGTVQLPPIRLLLRDQNKKGRRVSKDKSQRDVGSGSRVLRKERLLLSGQRNRDKGQESDS